MNNNFYIILPSNSSMSIYPNNKISEYKVQLPQSLNLDIMKWEVALSEIQYPNSWFNIRNGHNTLIKEYKNLTMKEIDIMFPPDVKVENKMRERKNLMNEMSKIGNISFQKRITLPEGYYSDIRLITTLIRNSEKNEQHQIKTIYNPIDSKTTFLIPNQTELNLNGSNIGKCLGFSHDSKLKGKQKSINLSIVKKYNSMYVYSNIIQNQNTGDIKVPLLRVIPIQSKYGEYVSVHYDRPHFLPISTSIIDTIEINIRDETGELISFESGSVIVTLQFRKRKNSLFE